MLLKITNLLFGLLSIILLGSFVSKVSSEEPKAPPPPRNIPGINDKDQFPKACVSCHKDFPDIKLDFRLSTIFTKWNEEIDPKLLAKFQTALPEGVTLKGKHPYKVSPNTSVPEACFKCHGKSKAALPMSQMAHIIHLTGGNENHFIAMFNGECTYCHKLDFKTGIWAIPNAKESEVE